MAPYLPILMYHDLDGERSPISMPPATFARQMHWLASNGYRAVPLRTLVRRLREKRPLPARAVVLTFDDGFESVYTHAAPILAKYGFAATVFLVTDYVGRHNGWPSQPASILRRPLLTWSQIRELAEQHIEFGAHTATHPMLDRVPPDQLVSELRHAKETLEARLGRPVVHFCYPYGRRSQAADEIVRQLYDGACSTALDVVDAGSDPYLLPRVEAQYVQSQVLATPMFPVYLSLRRALRTVGQQIRRSPWQ